MFWTDWGTYSRIERAGMDGTSRKSIVTSNLVVPNGLVIDTLQQRFEIQIKSVNDNVQYQFVNVFRIYWVDAGLNSLSSCDLNGLNRKEVIPTSLQYPFGITLHEDLIYWTDLVNNTIFSANKYDGKIKTLALLMLI